MKNKELLRKKYRSLRSGLALQTVRRKSDELASQLIALMQKNNPRVLHVFLPIIAEHEPDLRAVICYALDNGMEVYVSYPPVGKTVEVMENEYQQQLKKYRLQDNIFFDLVVVPMLAYDPVTNHRLGYGGGFYDRLLAKKRHCHAVGVCLSEYKVELPIEPHDEPLDQILTA